MTSQAIYGLSMERTGILGERSTIAPLYSYYVSESELLAKLYLFRNQELARLAHRLALELLATDKSGLNIKLTFKCWNNQAFMILVAILGNIPLFFCFRLSFSSSSSLKMESSESGIVSDDTPLFKSGGKKLKLMTISRN